MLYIVCDLIKYFICFRGVKEGCGLIVAEEHLTKYGTLDYEFIDKPETMNVHVFLVTHFSGVIKKTEGMEFILL